MAKLLKEGGHSHFTQLQHLLAGAILLFDSLIYQLELQAGKSVSQLLLFKISHQLVHFPHLLIQLGQRLIVVDAIDGDELAVHPIIMQLLPGIAGRNEPKV